MPSAHLTIAPAFTVGPVRRATFGSFVEHLGRCVYTGIYEPDHATATPEGFRGDVLELVRELGVSSVRYPGGNFVSGYRWEDGVGPADERPVRHDLAWHSLETNAFGLNEFMAWARQAEIEPMMAVNLGTRGIQESLDLLEYANGAEATALADLRRSHGVTEPHGITFWCLGNEMDGPWQLGHKTAVEYGRLAAETARAMRQYQSDLTLVACGSSSSGMPTFGEWEREVLEQAYDEIDLISAHAYYREEDDLGSFLASARDLDHFVASVAATADAVGAARKSRKRINISFDEWNVWYHAEENPAVVTGGAWPVAPAMEEDVYTVADAVVVGGLLIALLRNTDRVHSASQAQLVNAIAPIMTRPGGDAWRQTIFHPFALTARHARGEVLRVAIASDTYETARYGATDLVDAVATHDAGSGEVTVFLVNRGVDGATRVSLDASAFGGAEVLEAVTYAHSDHHWRASEEDATTVLPRSNDSAEVVDGVLALDLPAVSWSMVRLATAPTA
ncbi:alpha-N-arabinofuranosidase [Litorihabitans aurantiacus]|uniref:non-reducing end alpha-L-arabinofuranosidase n=1 Tax=Litorihabitans aurantiacus TaxID=1930061 RepID=A0AA38CVZ0_9MICO|nr:alpha-L-arabinofuranosidase C-terminal domain-containing protein [Litorihabitans aurantiacus]GMA33145.1 alpha-N-arabinofuranosidase [Litorihabitans aurantiacus]